MTDPIEEAEALLADTEHNDTIGAVTVRAVLRALIAAACADREACESLRADLAAANSENDELRARSMRSTDYEIGYDVGFCVGIEKRQGWIERAEVAEAALAKVKAERDAAIVGEWYAMACKEAAESALARALEAMPMDDETEYIRRLVSDHTGGAFVPYAPWDRVLDALDRLDAFRASQQQTPASEDDASGARTGVPPSPGDIGGPSGVKATEPGECAGCEGSGYVTWADRCADCHGTGKRKGGKHG